VHVHPHRGSRHARIHHLCTPRASHVIPQESRSSAPMLTTSFPPKVCQCSSPYAPPSVPVRVAESTTLYSEMPARTVLVREDEDRGETLKFPVGLFHTLVAF